MAAVTISTHNGSRVAREHNLRNPLVVSKEPHIEQDGRHETWLDVAPRAAYEKLFGDAVRDYNAKQTRDDRKIKDYYRQICSDGKKHPVYEMIVGIYGRDDNGISICDEKTGREILYRFAAGWKQRNPNLALIGAYYHNDEQGEPHVHLDYVPVAHGYKRGMETQTGLDRALREMGYRKEGRVTPQIAWEAQENAFLTDLCEERGLQVSHPRIEGIRHKSTEIYKQEKALDVRVEAMDALNREIGRLQDDRELMERTKTLKEAQHEAEQILQEAERDAGRTLQEAADRLATVHQQEDRVQQALQERDQALQELQQYQATLEQRVRAEIDRRTKEICEEAGNLAAQQAKEQARSIAEDLLLKGKDLLPDYVKSLQFGDGRNGLDHFMDFLEERQKAQEHEYTYTR